MTHTKRKCDNPECRREYMADERNLKRGWGLTCSKSCAASMREKKKPGYDPKRVEDNNARRILWDAKYHSEGKVTGHTSEGYRIIDGVAYDEFDDPIYTVDENEDAFDHGQE